MDLGLKDKVAIVTGAGRGIGRQIAITLSEEGAKVAVNDYYEDRANAVAFLASDRAEWITGQVLSVSGGYSMVD